MHLLHTYAYKNTKKLYNKLTKSSSTNAILTKEIWLNQPDVVCWRSSWLRLAWFDNYGTLSEPANRHLVLGCFKQVSQFD